MLVWRKALAVGLGVGLAANLSAAEDAPGFQWLGPRVGTRFFDASENNGNSPSLGAQGGLVFKGEQYGLSLEGFQYRSGNALLPGAKLRREGASLTFLSGAPAGSLWPYLGLGLGTLRVPEVDPLTFATTTTRATEAHLSLGFVDRQGRGFIWGLEGRSIFRLPIKSLHEIQVSLLAGFSWGGGAPAPAPPSAPSPRKALASPSAAITGPEAPQAAPSPVTGRPVARVPGRAIPDAVPTTPDAVPPAASTAVPLSAMPAVEGPAPAPAADAPAPQAASSEAAARPMASAPAAVAAGSAIGRLEALRRGDIPLALDLSRAYLQTLPASHWTLRLEAARLDVTLKNAAWAFPGKPDLFIAPLQLRDGKSMNQLFLGDYGTRVEAERALRTVPTYFQKDRLRPFPIQVSDIPARACPMTRPVTKPRPATTPAPKGIPVRLTSSCTRCH